MSDIEKNFIEKAAPEYWYSYSLELAEAADEIYASLKHKFVGYIFIDEDKNTQLERRPAVSRPVLLLYGLSFENMIKGILISEDTSRLNGGKLSSQLLGHDLVKLINQVKCLDVSPQERSLLKLLSDVVPYYGRYPVPKLAREVKFEEYLSSDIYSACKSLFKKLELALYKLNYDGLDAPAGVRFPNLRLPHRDSDADFSNDPVSLNFEQVEKQFKSDGF